LERFFVYSETPQKKYEDFAYVLDFIPNGKSMIITEREGPIAQAIGEERLTLLEILASPEAAFSPGDKIPIGKDNRDKIVSVLGKLNYDELTNEARNELLEVLEKIIHINEQKYVGYFNELQPITPRLHALELIPGIGKTFMREIVNERDKKKFESFHDLEKRIGIRDPAKLIAKRVIQELSGESKISIFTTH
jgi:putative nucleotide binding protein